MYVRGQPGQEKSSGFEFMYRDEDELAIGSYSDMQYILPSWQRAQVALKLP
jgi:hypothetical protein